MVVKSLHWKQIRSVVNDLAGQLNTVTSAVGLLSIFPRTLRFFAGR
jgi:hypothetical protein